MFLYPLLSDVVFKKAVLLCPPPCSIMPPRKRQCPEVEEYYFDSDDEPQLSFTSFHRHTHVESINGRITAEQTMYSMPNSEPDPLGTVGISESIQTSDTLIDNDTVGLDGILSETADHADGSRAPIVSSNFWRKYPM